MSDEYPDLRGSVEEIPCQCCCECRAALHPEGWWPQVKVQYVGFNPSAFSIPSCEPTRAVWNYPDQQIRSEAGPWPVPPRDPNLPPFTVYNWSAHDHLGPCTGAGRPMHLLDDGHQADVFFFTGSVDNPSDYDTPDAEYAAILTTLGVDPRAWRVRGWHVNTPDQFYTCEMSDGILKGRSCLSVFDGDIAVPTFVQEALEDRYMRGLGYTTKVGPREWSLGFSAYPEATVTLTGLYVALPQMQTETIAFWDDPSKPYHARPKVIHVGVRGNLYPPPLFGRDFTGFWGLNHEIYFRKRRFIPFTAGLLGNGPSVVLSRSERIVVSDVECVWANSTKDANYAKTGDVVATAQGITSGYGSLSGFVSPGFVEWPAGHWPSEVFGTPGTPEYWVPSLTKVFLNGSSSQIPYRYGDQTDKYRFFSGLGLVGNPHQWNQQWIEDVKGYLTGGYGDSISVSQGPPDVSVAKEMTFSLGLHPSGLGRVGGAAMYRVTPVERRRFCPIRSATQCPTQYTLYDYADGSVIDTQPLSPGFRSIDFEASWKSPDSKVWVNFGGFYSLEVEGANSDIGRAFVNSLDPLEMTFATIRISANGTLTTAWAVVTGDESGCIPRCYGGADNPRWDSSGGPSGGPSPQDGSSGPMGFFAPVIVDGEGDSSEWVTILGGGE